VLVHVVGLFAGCDPISEAAAFIDDLILADFQVVSNRVERLKKDAAKPRPDRDELKAELEALLPIAERLENGDELADMEFSEAQVKAASSFALLTRKRRLIVLNTADSDIDAGILTDLEAAGHAVVAAPAGLELEVLALSEEERSEFAAEMGLAEPSRARMLRKIFEVTDQITFYTCAEKEVHAWLLNRGETVLDAADTIHSDLARGFVRAEIWSADDLLRLGSERELKAANLQHVEGKEYVVQDGDEIFIRSGI
jgi:hypothetical protein